MSNKAHERTDEQKAQHNLLFTDHKPNFDIITRLKRRGFIKGQHAYEAGMSLHAHDHLGDDHEIEGFKMGWQARYVDELCDLEPAALGKLQDIGVPDDWDNAG